MTSYLAGSIFYAGDAYRNAAFSKAIRDSIDGIDLYNPLENTAINGPEGKKKCATSVMIAERTMRVSTTPMSCLPVWMGMSSPPEPLLKSAGSPRCRVTALSSASLPITVPPTRRRAKDWQLAYIGENQYCYQNLYVIGLIKQHGVVVDNIMEAVRYAKEWGEHHGKC